MGALFLPQHATDALEEYWKKIYFTMRLMKPYLRIRMVCFRVLKEKPDSEISINLQVVQFELYQQIAWTKMSKLMLKKKPVSGEVRLVATLGVTQRCITGRNLQIHWVQIGNVTGTGNTLFLVMIKFRADRYSDGSEGFKISVS